MGKRSKSLTMWGGYDTNNFEDHSLANGVTPHQNHAQQGVEMHSSESDGTDSDSGSMMPAYNQPTYAATTATAQNVWETHYNDQGVPYYFNNVTQETQWNEPAGGQA